MKSLSLLVLCFALCPYAMAKDKKESANLVQKVEEAARKSILQDIKVNVEISHDASVCGSEPGDVVMAEVLLRKASRDEKGNSKDRWDTIESYAAPLKEFEKVGAKAFMKEGQCQE